MPTRLLPDHDYLRECFDYDPLTGVLRWRDRPREHFPTDRGWRTFNGLFAGRVAGSGKYRSVCITWQSYELSHIIWKLMTGEDVPEMIDHKDRNLLNTCWDNLRLATRSENQWNSTVQRNNQSGLKGTCYDKRRNRYSARISVTGKLIYLGTFGTPEAAHAAYCDAARTLYGKFWCDGTPITT